MIVALLDWIVSVGVAVLFGYGIGCFVDWCFSRKRR